MPGSKDWKDYIPASGEASVQLGLRGRYGGKGSSRMRYRRRSRFRKPFFKTRFWNASSENLVPGSAGQMSTSGPTAILGISPNLAMQTPTSADSNFQYMQKLKLVGIQGSIPVWIPPSRELGIAVEDTGAQSVPYILFYAWKVIQLTPDTQAAETAVSNDPSPVNDLSAMLAGDDVLNWGHVHIPKWDYARNGHGIWTWLSSGLPGDVAVPLPTDQENGPPASNMYVASSHHTRYFGYIPKPRIPKYGINLGRTRALVCYARPMQWSINGEAWQSATLGPWYQPLLRCRWER